MSPIDMAQSIFTNIIPANSGFYVLDILIGNDDAIEPIKYPVIAWAMEKDTLAPLPITYDGVQLNNPYILQPHGMVFSSSDGYPSIGEWLADQDKLRRKGAPT